MCDFGLFSTLIKKQDMPEALLDFKRIVDSAEGLETSYALLLSMGLESVLQEQEMKQICENRVPQSVKRLISGFERAANSANPPEGVSELLDPDRGFGFAP